MTSRRNVNGTSGSGARLWMQRRPCGSPSCLLISLATHVCREAEFVPCTESTLPNIMRASSRPGSASAPLLCTVQLHDPTTRPCERDSHSADRDVEPTTWRMHHSVSYQQLMGQTDIHAPRRHFGSQPTPDDGVGLDVRAAVWMRPRRRRKSAGQIILGEGQRQRSPRQLRDISYWSICRKRHNPARSWLASVA